MKSRAHLIINGRVQGVFYRAHAQKMAKKLDLTGWVKNNIDRSVEVVIEGEESTIKEFVKLCNKGPMLAKVDSINTSWEKYTGEFATFSIR